ncbi:MAG: hypothetical protein HYU57_09150 [Micavibrio aeruginosavorus]|nr:hypothetical protein [Micavibrio aeruginosavorus]
MTYKLAYKLAAEAVIVGAVAAASAFGFASYRKYHLYSADHVVLLSQDARTGKASIVRLKGQIVSSPPTGSRTKWMAARDDVALADLALLPSRKLTTPETLAAQYSVALRNGADVLNKVNALQNDPSQPKDVCLGYYMPQINTANPGIVDTASLQKALSCGETYLAFRYIPLSGEGMAKAQTLLREVQGVTKTLGDSAAIHRLVQKPEV